MKTIINPRTVVAPDGKSAVITVDIVDQPFNAMLITRVTHTHLNPTNVKHPRHIQSSSEAVFVRSRNGTAAMPNDTVIEIFAAIEPATTFAPVFKKNATPVSVAVASELPATFQWQISDYVSSAPTPPPASAKWSDIPGATNAKLDESALKDGQWVRCVASNAVGSTASQPVQFVSKQ